MQVNVFGYENKVCPLYISKKLIIKHLLLFIINHWVFIKDFNRLMFSKTEYKDKKHFSMSCL